MVRVRPFLAPLRGNYYKPHQVGKDVKITQLSPKNLNSLMKIQLIPFFIIYPKLAMGFIKGTYSPPPGKIGLNDLQIPLVIGVVVWRFSPNYIHTFSKALYHKKSI